MQAHWSHQMRRNSGRHRKGDPERFRRAIHSDQAFRSASTGRRSPRSTACFRRTPASPSDPRSSAASRCRRRSSRSSRNSSGRHTHTREAQSADAEPQSADPLFVTVPPLPAGHHQASEDRHLTVDAPIPEPELRAEPETRPCVERSYPRSPPKRAGQRREPEIDVVPATERQRGAASVERPTDRRARRRAGAAAAADSAMFVAVTLFSMLAIGIWWAHAGRAARQHDQIERTGGPSRNPTITSRVPTSACRPRTGRCGTQLDPGVHRQGFECGKRAQRDVGEAKHEEALISCVSVPAHPAPGDDRRQPGRAGADRRQARDLRHRGARAGGARTRRCRSRAISANWATARAKHYAVGNARADFLFEIDVPAETRAGGTIAINSFDMTASRSISTRSRFRWISRFHRSSSASSVSMRSASAAGLSQRSREMRGKRIATPDLCRVDQFSPSNATSSTRPCLRSARTERTEPDRSTVLSRTYLSICRSSSSVKPK